MKQTISKEEVINGKVLLIDKPYGWTSFDVVKKIRYMLKYRYNLKKIKVGHAGTLDPLATGLMVICLGKATKKIPGLMNSDKEYQATIILGASTPSFDLETEINQTYPVDHIQEENIKKVLNQQFFGTIQQVPPLYSAKHVKGVRAYELARKGKEVKLDPVQVEIHNIELLTLNMPEVKLKIKCSKGTYIRSLANDIGIALHSGAYLSELKRIASGEFTLQDAISVRELEKVFKKQN